MGAAGAADTAGRSRHTGKSGSPADAAACRARPEASDRPAEPGRSRRADRAGAEATGSADHATEGADRAGRSHPTADRATHGPTH